MTDYLMLGLTKRQVELTGEIERTHENLSKMLADLESPDQTFRNFSPNFQVETFRAKAFRPIGRIGAG